MRHYLIYMSLLKIVMLTLLSVLEAEQTFPPSSHICKEALWNMLRPSLLLCLYLVTFLVLPLTMERLNNVCHFTTWSLKHHRVTLL